MKMKDCSQEKCFLPFPRKVSQEFWSIKQGRQKKKKTNSHDRGETNFQHSEHLGGCPEMAVGPSEFP